MKLQIDLMIKLLLSYKVNGEWKFHCFDCTTDPGTHWVENIMRKEGVAILKTRSI